MAEEKSSGGSSRETRNVQPQQINDRPAPIWNNVKPEQRPSAPIKPPSDD
jgi:hypothetical protein